MTNLDSILKSRDITLLTLVHLVKASLVAQRVKHLPAMWETWVQSLGGADLLEKEMVTHSSILAWKIPWMEEPGRLQSMGVAKSQTQLSDVTFTFHFHALEKEMATHSSVLAWRIPGTGEPGGDRKSVV